MARVFLKEVVKEARRRRLLSADHFTIDGTLLEAWASDKSYFRAARRRPKAVDATNPATSRASAGTARRTSRPPILRRGSTAKASSRARGSATWVIR